MCIIHNIKLKYNFYFILFLNFLFYFLQEPVKFGKYFFLNVIDKIKIIN